MARIILKNLVILFFLLFIVSCKDNRTGYQKASDFFDKGEYNNAVLYFNKALKDGVKTSLLYKKLANSYIKINRLNEAKEALKEALLLTPDDEDLVYLYVDLLMKKKQYYNVINRLKAIADSRRKYMLLSKVYFLSGNSKYSFDYLDKATKYIDNNEEKVKLIYDFAKKILNYEKKCTEKNKLFKMLYKDLKDDATFLKYYYKALICDYGDKIQNRVAIRLYNKDKKERENIKFNILNLIIDKSPDKFHYNELIQIYIDRRDVNKASKILRLSKNIDSSQSILLFLEAQIDYQFKRYEISIEKLTKYLNSKKERDVNVLRYLAKTEYIVKNNFSSIKHFKEVIELDKYDKESLYKLKALYERVGNKEEQTNIEYKIKFFYRKFYR